MDTRGMSSRDPRVPTLVANPANDRVFADFAQLLVDDGATSVRELERRLRVAYPNAVVHARELAAEPVLIWYVYREGHWVRAMADTSGELPHDVQPKG